MDKKLSHTVDVLDAIDGYYSSIKPYLQQTDNVKYIYIEKRVDKCQEYKKKFKQLIDQKLDDAALFYIVHLYVSMNALLTDMYQQLDFVVYPGDLLSTTRTYRITTAFNDITKIYRVYMHDLVGELQELVTQVAGMVTSKDPVVLQACWQKHPQSIDLYNLVVERVLNQTYRDHDQAKAALIFELLERDKHFILGQQPWLSAYLSYNCLPLASTPVPVPFATISTLLGVPALRLIHNVILIKRMQTVNLVHLIPKSVNADIGITAQDVSVTLHELPAASYNWDVEVRGVAPHYMFEQSGADLYRVLVPWKNPNNHQLPASLSTKIKQHDYGRPAAYHRQLELSLVKILNPRVAVLSEETARKNDVALSVLRVTESIMVVVKRGKGGADRMYEEYVDTAFETAVFTELDPKLFHLKDLLLFWVESTRKLFRKDLDAGLKKIRGQPWNIDVEQLAEKILHDAVNEQLKKSANLFQDLLDKQHKIDTVMLNT